MDTDDIFLMLMYYSAASVFVVPSKKRRKRRYKTRPLNQNRDRTSVYNNLVKFAKDRDYEQYFKYTRLSPDMFNYLLTLVGGRLQRDRKKSHISPGCRLTMTLHFLSEGCSMQQIAWDYYVGKSTVHMIINETTSVLWEVLMPIYLPAPSQEMWVNISRGFYRRWNIPNCLGALDGKHINIQAPKHSGSDFFNYKKNFSIVLMGMCDAFYRFTLVDIGSPGSNHDSTVFKTSAVGRAFLSENLHFPENIVLPGSNIQMSYFAVADQAFPLHKRIMRPFPGENLGDTKTIFNYRLSRARRTIENTFGIVAQRWRIIRKTIIGNLETCENIVKAVVVLHNYCQIAEEDIPITERRYCPTGFSDYADSNGVMHYGSWRDHRTPLRSIGRVGTNNATAFVKKTRETLAEYFVNPVGSVPWQQAYIRRGFEPSNQ